VRIDDFELRSQAAMLGEIDGGHTITTFIGFANFAPTGLTSFVDTGAMQVRLFFVKEDYFMIAALSGTNQYNFFDYANMRLHQV